jgi:hypothetical protein
VFLLIVLPLYHNNLLIFPYVASSIDQVACYHYISTFYMQRMPSVRTWVSHLQVAGFCPSSELYLSDFIDELNL